MSNSDRKQGEERGHSKLYLIFSRQGVEGYFMPKAGSRSVELVSALGCDDPDGLLPFIENAIYDNPELIDDIPAEIIVSTPYLLLFPADYPEEDMLSIAAETFAMEESDIFIEEYLPGIVSAFALCKGFRSFILRTFPGINVIHSSQPMARRGMQATSSDEEKILVGMRDGITDFAALRGRNLLHASSHEGSSEANTAYFIFKIWAECGFNPASATVYLDAPKDIRDSLLPLLRKHINYARILVAPLSDYDIKLPLPIAIRHKLTLEQ